MPRYVVDAMLGNVARKLRMMGYDAVYADGGACVDDRVLITKNVRLAAAATRRGVAVICGMTERQIMRDVLCGERPVVSIDRARCSICNGVTEITPHVIPPRKRVWRCVSCGHHYWDGTHMEKIREAVRDWI